MTTDRHTAKKDAPSTQFAWWRPGGFRLPVLARLTKGKVGLGRWTQGEIAAIETRAEAGVKALRGCVEHAEPRCAHPRVLPPATEDEPTALAWTPDDVMEAGVEEFKRLWPEKWEAWLAWLAWQSVQNATIGNDGLTDSERADDLASFRETVGSRIQPCWCWRCHEDRKQPILFMIVCPDCGNKRCPKANDHDNACTGSNDEGQPGSAYEHGSARRLGWEGDK